ncbi:transposable element Tc3 transposase [Trichonephila clavipes]|nr:transposable element Tc3 transposase [Trichonephila clavipes]
MARARVWGGIILGSRTDLHVQSVTMTGHIYRDVILEQHVRLFRGAKGAEFLFMNDNARPHHASIVDECLQSEDITPFERLRRFREGRESVEDDKRSGRPQTFLPAKNIENVSAAVRKNRLRTLAGSVGISSAACQWTLTKDLNIHRVCQHLVPRMLNKDQYADEVKSASQAELKDMAKNGFWKCFDEL